MASYPIYLLELGDELKMVFPVDKADIGHTDFWEQTASLLVAEHYKVPQKMLANLPYCQRRARIVGDTLYYGEKDGAEVLQLARQAFGAELVLCFDEHEKRLREDEREFRWLLNRLAPQC